ncbi:sugar kinase [Streptomyces purpurascens]|uniref:sugar kinase n=1 Tax=Streptomyces purpurascens TaxID=1924 RepID=UPI00198AEE30|nr:sugar kinase [Streptomyces purpurascens]MCE7050976.1 sugar kinase [Streptomyces purpurascens]GHA23687.1 carbohydrate kinase [Streptomyces purpurascens]
MPHPTVVSPEHPPADVVCLGETMAVLSPPDDRPLADQSALRLSVGGAESNVACGLAALGHRAAWLSRVGDDAFGRRIRAELAARGVEVGGVAVDPAHPTGVYFKDPGPDATRPLYYRSGSAAAHMGPELAGAPELRGPRIVHVSGITAALSGSCAGLLEEIVVRRTPWDDAVRRPLISFDVNHRPALWTGRTADAAPALRDLARAADLVFVGRDEAEALWGTAHPDDIASLLAPAPLVVVKDAEHGATSYATGDVTFVPAPEIEVVEPVGAGDAFAAGYLSGVLTDLDEASRLRLGHLTAATALRSRDDIPDLSEALDLARR